MRTGDRIRVSLTVEQWNALYSYGKAEAEAISGDTYRGDDSEHLNAALRAMERGRAMASRKVST
jgi:hypothetical protein